MVPSKTTILEQKLFLRGRQKFELTEDDHIEVTFQDFSVHRKFKLPIWQIDPEPERIKYREGGTILGIWIFGILWIGTLIGAIFINDVGARMAIIFFPGLLFSIPFVACIVKFKKKSLDCLSFALRDGGALHIWHEKPDAKTFHAFCEELSRRAKGGFQTEVHKTDKSLSAEIRELAKLKADGVLSDAEFERAKTKLIDTAGERKIGFSS